MNEFTLTYPAGRLDLELCVSSGQVFRWERLESGEWIGVDGEHWYRVWLDPAVGREEQRLGYRALTQATGINPDRTRDALAKVAEPRRQYGEQTETLRVVSNGTEQDLISFFRLDCDSDEIEAKILERAPELAPYMAAMSGLRLLRPSDPVETFYSFLCSPNNNLPRIVQMVRHLASLGEQMENPLGRTLQRFPGSETIASIDPASLRAKAFGYRADTIPAAARQVLDRGGDDWIKSLKHEPYEQAHARLVEIKGIGPKLADCICLFSLHHTLAVPVDTHLLQAAVRLYFPELKGKALTDLRYRQIGDHFRERFGELTGWAHQYLFYDNMLNWRGRK
jgi:N-glycosylase/DNA lyase